MTATHRCGGIVRSMRAQRFGMVSLVGMTWALTAACPRSHRGSPRSSIHTPTDLSATARPPEPPNDLVAIAHLEHPHASAASVTRITGRAAPLDLVLAMV